MKLLSFLIPPILVFSIRADQVVYTVNDIKLLTLENLKIRSQDSPTDSCVNQTNLLIHKLFKENWATQMFDASTKFPDSIMMGLLINLGNFEECLEVKNIKTEYGKFNAQYCLATIPLPTNKSMKTNVHENIPRTVTQTGNHIGGNPVISSNIQLSYCIPSVCSPEDLKKILSDNIFSHLGFPIHVSDVTCQQTKERELSAGDWSAVAILILIGTLAVASTSYDLFMKGPKYKLLTTFSWYSNGKKLLNTESTADTLKAIHGIRFLSMCWVVLGHELTPPYALMVLLEATLQRHVSSGPIFNSSVDSIAEKCRKNWWTNLLYINNYVENKDMGWYLAIDMQLFLLSPIVLFPLWKWPMRWSLSLLGVLSLGGLITTFTISFIDELPVSIITIDQDYKYLMYYPTHTRFVPWLIGVGFGPVNTFLSWKLFQPLSRLTYCVYLVHLSLQTVRTYSHRTPVYVSDIETIPEFFGDLVISLLLAVVLSLCVEAPTIAIENHFLKEDKSERNDNESHPENEDEVKQFAYSSLQETTEVSNTNNMAQSHQNEIRLTQEEDRLNSC
ncbi:hypothetical protein C0J52_07346 [Blattella germanica]|nr:hypothetical protein C0J52_07346 [Blattella germanica]